MLALKGVICGNTVIVENDSIEKIQWTRGDSNNPGFFGPKTPGIKFR